MSRIFREILRKQSSNRLITTFTQKSPSISPPLSCLQKKVNFDGEKGLKIDENLTHLSKMGFYPSFSFGYFLDPILGSGSGQIQVMGNGLGDMEHPGMMWADSVKKKRKKKMNKHKYKKLRKRLRRKTKT